MAHLTDIEPISDYLNPRFLEEIDTSSVSTILEFGAHDGRDTLALCLRFGARIHAFECHPDFFPIARDRCRPYPKIHLVERAVWDADTRIPFYPVVRTMVEGGVIDNPGASSCFRACDDYHQIYEQSATEVEAIRIENYCAEHRMDRIDLLCMDVQGAGLHALRGFGDRLRDVRYLIAEIETRPLYVG
ncbi:MAG: FkbM family methyltransferase, partial [Verrucomicrobiales bacterium]